MVSLRLAALIPEPLPCGCPITALYTALTLLGLSLRVFIMCVLVGCGLLFR